MMQTRKKHLSPEMVSKRGSSYYLFQLQTSPTKSQKVVAYSPSKRIKLQYLQDSKSPVKLERLMDTSEDPIFNNQSFLKEIQPYDIDFAYSDTELVLGTKCNITPSTLVNIEQLKQYSPFTETLFSVKAQLNYGDAPLKIVKTRFDTESKVKDDAILIDESGQINFHIWETLYNQVQTGTAYNITDLALKKFRGELFVSSTTKSLLEEIQLDYTPPPVTSNEEIVQIHKFESVRSTDIYLHCRKCHRKIEIIAAKKILKCSQCGSSQRSSDLDMGATCIVEYLDQEAVCIKDVIQTILLWESKEIKIATEADIEEPILAINEPINLKIKDGKIVEISKSIDNN